MSETAILTVEKPVYKYPPMSVEQIDEAMAKVSGNRDLACQVLGIPDSKLAELIDASSVLREKWNPKDQRQPVELDVTTTMSDEDLAKMVAKEDKKLRNGIEKMGGDAADVELALALRKFNGGHIERSVDMMTAGVTLNSIRMLRMLRNMEARIEKQSSLPASETIRAEEKGAPPIVEENGGFRFNVDGEPTEEEMVLSSYIALNGEYRKTVELMLKGSLVKAKIESMKKKGGSGKRGGSAGWKAKGDVKIVAQNVQVGG